MSKRILSLVLMLAMLLGLLPAGALTAQASEAQNSVHVAFSLSNDGAYVIGNDENSTRLDKTEADVPYFDLAAYDLSQYYRYETDENGDYIGDEVIQQPTVLHLYIYMLERYYYGLPEEDCCKGKKHLEELGITFGDANDSSALDELGHEVGSNAALTVSGAATSLYMTYFWGHDQNLMYFVNNAYPEMRPGWGATSDYLLLQEGDDIDVAMFTDWGFFTHGNFAQIEAERTEAAVGEALTFQAVGAQTMAVEGDGSEAPTPIQVLWVVLDDQNNVIYQPEDTVAPTSSFTYSFEEAGTYKVCAYDPARGTDTACIAPDSVTVSVTGPSMPTVPEGQNRTISLNPALTGQCVIDLSTLFENAQTYTVSTDGVEYTETGARYLFDLQEAAGLSHLYFQAANENGSSEPLELTLDMGEKQLSKLRLAKGGSATSGTYPISAVFAAGELCYGITVPDNAITLHLDASYPEGMDCIASYPDVSMDGSTLEVPIKADTPTRLSGIVTRYGPDNTLDVNLLSNGEAAESYHFEILRLRTLRSLRVMDEQENPLILSDKFNLEILEYFTSTNSASVTVNATAQSADYQLTYNGDTNNVIALQDGENRVEIRVENPADSTYTTYVLHIFKTEPVQISFTAEPAEAIVTLTDGEGHVQTPDAEGNYTVLPGSVYNYTATLYGYVGQKNRFQVSEGGIIELVLDKAQDNPAIDKTIYAQWANFRNGENHLGVIDSKTPYAPEDSELLWATKHGTGWAAAPGSPIMVDGDIITYVGSRIMRLDAETGEQLAVSDMVGSSSFSIVPPTYADGMIFVGLANGTIQAFNAKTLESLWVYRDPLKGQPNCPITYKDGYVYAGFWNSPRADANFVCLSVTDEDIENTHEEKLASWTYASKGGYYWAGAYVNEKYAVVGCDAHTLMVFDRLTGQLLDKDDHFTGEIRSNVSYDPKSDRVFFTTKGGELNNAKIDWETGKILDTNTTVIVNAHGTEHAMSTCTPSIYNDRVYIGVSGDSQFGAESGHCIAVYDLMEDGSMVRAYAYEIQGYPQTSAMVATGYEKETGYVYIYLPYNMTPGGIAVLKDKKGQTEPLTTTDGTYSEVFTPKGPLSQYAICSTIADEYGTLYYKNDSCYMMAISSKLESIEVTQDPAKIRYDGEVFDPAGMKVVVNLHNGMQRDITDYVTFPEEALTLEDTTVTLSYTYGFDDPNYGRKTLTTELAINKPSVTAQVDILTQAYNGFLMAPMEKATVDSYTAEAYGYTDEIPYFAGVSALDVLVYAHEQMFGEAFLPETASELLKVTEQGWIKTIFGVETSNCGFSVNGVTPTMDESSEWGGYLAYTVAQAPVQTGDSLNFYVYQDDYALDNYTWMEQNGAYTEMLTAEAKLPTEITVKGYCIGYYGFYYKSFAEARKDAEKVSEVEGARLAFVNMETGEITDVSEALTDENGKITVSFPEPGDYVLTAYVTDESIADYSTPAIMTLTKLHVTAHTEHQWSDWTVETPATCTEDGLEFRTCPCGEREERVLLATGHEWSSWTVETEATCTEDGLQVRICQKCGERVESVIPATGHDWSDWMVETEATCTEDGLEVRTCGNCGEKQTRVIPATGHNWSDWMVETEATCTKDGLEVRTCGNCGEKQTRVIPATGHDWSEWTVETEATCTKDGLEVRTCGHCGEKETRVISATGHNWSEWTVEKEATCSEEGLEVRTCSVCGEKQTRSLERIPHTWTETVVAPTCTTAGYTEHTCSVCGETYRDAYTSALGHKLELRNYVEPTCFKPGYSGDLYCTVCNELIEQGHELPANSDHCPSKEFTDVNPNEWYHEAVDFVISEGIMNGMGHDLFVPNGVLTRGQMVTVLYRLAGEPEVTAASTFVDVDADDFFADAVAWAQETGITEGMDETHFGPKVQLTREQLVTFLYRFHEEPETEGDLSQYPDADRISDYAVPAMTWAVEQEIVNGIDGKLMPRELTTRAQLAAMLFRILG